MLQPVPHHPLRPVFERHEVCLGSLARAIGRSYQSTANYLSGRTQPPPAIEAKLQEVAAHLERGVAL